MVKQLGLIIIPFDNQIGSKLDFIREDYHKKNIWFYQYSDFLCRPNDFITLLETHYQLDKRIFLNMGIIRNIKLFYPNIKERIDFEYTQAYLEAWKINTTTMLQKSKFPFKIVYLDSIIKKQGAVEYIS